MMWQTVIEQFVSLWVVIDPIGTIPVFIGVTKSLSPAMQRKTAIRAILYSGLILLLFLIGGQFLLEAMQIPLTAFQVAGGIVLFLFALTMIFGDSKPEQEEKLPLEEGSDIAVFPLAIPSIASPGAMMAVVVLTDNHRFDIEHQMLTALIMLSVLIITLILLIFAGKIQKVIGNAGASIVSRVMGLILAAVATEHVLFALKQYFQTV